MSVAAETAEPAADVAPAMAALLGPEVAVWAADGGWRTSQLALRSGRPGTAAGVAAGMMPEPALVADCTGAVDPAAPAAFETVPVTADATDPAIDVAPEEAVLPEPELLAGSADGVTALVGSDPAAGVAVEEVPEPLLAAAGGASAADPLVPVAGGATGPAAGAAGAVAAEVTGAAAEVTEVTAEVADAETADVAGASADVGESAACACRDSPSKTATTPIVKIVTCTARRAMCRNSGWDTRAPARSGEAANLDFPG